MVKIRRTSYLRFSLLLLLSIGGFNKTSLWAIPASGTDSISKSQPSDTLTTSNTIGTESWYQIQFQNLVSAEDSLVLLSIQALTSYSQMRDYELLKGIFSGQVYQYPSSNKNYGLVLAGEEITDENGDSKVPLFSIYPKKTAVLNDQNEPLYIDPMELTDLETGRETREMIQPYLNKMELFHALPEIRKNATELIGNSGDSTSMSVLEASLVDEKDNSVRILKLVSLAKLKLKYGNNDQVMEAAQKLGELKSPLAVPALEARLKQEKSKSIQEQNKHVITYIKKALGSLHTFATVMNVIQTSFIGLSLGSILILVALGLAIIYGLMGIINMAHGEFMMIGAYTTFVVQGICAKMLPAAYFDWFFVISLPCAFLVAGIIGYFIEILIVRHLYNRPLESLLATWGVSLCLIQLSRNIFGDLTAVKMPALLSGGLEIAPQVILPYNRIFLVGLTVVCIFLIYLIFNRTTFGLKLRAVTQNRNMSSCMGISVRRVDSLTFFLGTGIAGIAGWGMTLIGNVVPDMGQTYIVDSFLVVVTGGVGKLMGTILAGLGIGVTNKFIEPIFEAVYAKVIILGAIILFLQVRPTGIFPSKGRNADD